MNWVEMKVKKILVRMPRLRLKLLEKVKWFLNQMNQSQLTMKKVLEKALKQKT